MNTRAKGGRIFRKAVAYAKLTPGVVTIPLYQVSRWAQEQPFDMLVLRPGCWIRLVEVRFGQWRTGKPSTKALAALPGRYYAKQIWMFPEGAATPKVREWTGEAWLMRPSPWWNVDELPGGADAP